MSTGPRRLALLNPNTNTATTALMAGIARGLCPPGVEMQGHTMLLGPSVITDEPALEAAARQVVTVGTGLAAEGVGALVVAAFGDPGLAELRDRVGVPVTGIAEAGMAEAAAGGRRFSIITTTPALERSILGKVEEYGHAGQLASLRISQGDAFRVMADEERMCAALIGLARDCARDGAEALLLGGGPLARAAGRVAAATGLPIIEPVAAGTRRALRLMGLAPAG